METYTTKVYVKHWRKAWFVDPDESPGLVRWHRKNRTDIDYNYFTPLTRGGKTEVTIQVFDEHNDPVIKFTGVAECSMDDNFCYKRGREIAFGRAMKQLMQWREDNGY